MTTEAIPGDSRLFADQHADQHADQRGDDRFAGCGPAMRKVRALAEKVAATPISILVLGECGVGKDVLAQAIHVRSRRAAKPFVAINCAAIPESLIASELFGYEKGAFTGAAHTGKVGLLESANGGTVFLDEIGDMPTSLQATLLRVLETRELRPVMAVRSRPLDVRFIAATNKNLELAVERGQFRSDLLYRLNTLTLFVPPLRERTEEIPHLAREFVDGAWRRAERPGRPRIGAEVMEWLVRQPWPGNIRELKNLMECAVTLAEGPEIRLGDLAVSDPRVAFPPSGDVAGEGEGERSNVVPIDPVTKPEKQRIVEALDACNGNQTRAARLLRMSRRTFVSRLDFYQLPRPQKGLESRGVTPILSAAPNAGRSPRGGRPPGPVVALGNEQLQVSGLHGGSATA